MPVSRDETLLIGRDRLVPRFASFNPADSLVVLKHPKLIMASFSPDGCRVITASDDGSARIWNTARDKSSLERWHATAVRYGLWNPAEERLLREHAHDEKVIPIDLPGGCDPMSQRDQAWNHANLVRAGYALLPRSPEQARELSQRVRMSFPALSDKQVERSASELIATTYLLDNDTSQVRVALGSGGPEGGTAMRISLARVAHEPMARPDLALRLLDGALAEDPTSLAAALTRAEILLALHRYAEALSDAQTLAPRARGPRDQVVLHAVAWAAETLLEAPRRHRRSGSSAPTERSPADSPPAGTSSAPGAPFATARIAPRRSPRSWTCSGGSASPSARTSRNVGHVFSPDGVRVTWASNARNGRDYDIWLSDGRSAESAALVVPREGNWVPLGFTRDGRRLLIRRYLSPVESELHLVDLSTRKVTPVLLPGGPGAYRAAKLAPDGRWVYASVDGASPFLSVLTSRVARSRPGTLPLHAGAAARERQRAPSRGRHANLHGFELHSFNGCGC